MLERLSIRESTSLLKMLVSTVRMMLVVVMVMVQQGEMDDLGIRVV